MMSQRKLRCCSISALDTDLDVMFFPLKNKACFSGHENILVEPLVTESEGFTGYAQLTYLTTDFKGEYVSSKLSRSIAKHAIGNARIANSLRLSHGATFRMRLDSKGPSMKLRISCFFEADITVCVQCIEWPPMSDWPTRQRYWPSVCQAQRIMTLGCHLVTKPALSDKDETSWRFSFSLAERVLSKLVPDTARKCFLALKIILKDHLQPVSSEITSYHIKTIFLNTLEKVPVGFWVEENIEECFLTLLAELRDALISMNCPHHWFSNVNLFDTKGSCSCIKVNSFQRLAKKVQRILNNPAPFIFDDGCCCLSPCCFCAPRSNFTRRSSEQFLEDYNEVARQVITREDDPDNHSYQLPVSPSPRTEAEIHPSYYPSGEYDQGITPAGPEVRVVCHPPRDVAEQEPGFCVGEHGQGITAATEALEEPSFCAGEHGQGTTAGPEVLVVCHPPRHIAELEPSISAVERGQGTTAGSDQLVVDLSFCAGDTEDEAFLLPAQDA